MTGPPSIALVDLASVAPSMKSEAEVVDAIDLAEALIRKVVVDRRAPDTGIHEARCRFYGGWFDINGIPLQQHGWLLRGLRGFGGLQDGVRLIPEVAEALLCQPAKRFIATYKNRGQKMVDQMLSLDAHYLVRNGHSTLLVISDDDDFVPTVVAVVAESAGEIIWLRQRDESYNDFHFDATRVELITDNRWR